jgi:hypothetical protein
MIKRILSFLAISIALNIFVPAAGIAAIEAAKNSETDPWWKHAVFYEIYPRSFAD